MSKTATILGKVSVTPKGAWNGANSYNFLDIVSNAGSSYLAVQPVAAGTPLDNTSFWLQIAAKGDPGQDGTDGAAGEITGASASISGGVGTPGVTVTPGGTPTARTFTFAFVNLKGEQGETGNGIASIVKTGTAGLVDTYTVTYTDGTTMTYEVKNGAEALDATLTLEGYAADAKAVGDALALKQNAADPAGLADNLTPYSADSGATQAIPFIAQGTGCGNGESIVDTGNYAQVKKKLGNTVCVNQLIPIPTNSLSKTENGVTFTDSRDGTYTIQTTAEGATADTYITVYDQTTDRAGRTCILFGAPSGASATTHFLSDAMGSIGRDTGMGVIGDVYSNGRVIIRITVKSGAIITTPVTYRPKLCDLDIWYGSHGNIPAHLLSHPEDFGRYYSGSLAYNPGQLVNADGSVLTSIGRNVWDEEWAVGYWGNDGAFYTNDPTRIATKNLIKVISNTQYYIQSPSLTAFISEYDYGGNFIRRYARGLPNPITTATNCGYIAVSFNPTYGTTYNHDITISLYYPGESGYDQYYPYTVLAQIDTGSEVPRSAGSVADEKAPDGTITRNVGSVDMGTLTWTYVTNDGEPYFYAPISDKKIEPFNIQSGKYVTSSLAGTTNLPDKGIVGSGTMARVFVRDTAYTDASVLASALSGVYLNYELATPTTEQGTPFSGASADNFAIDDFGSMYWTQSAGVPQGVEIFYPYDYKAAVDTILNEVNGDVTKLVTSEKVPDAPSSNGTYVLKVTVSGGTPTYSWVAE